MLEQNLKTFKEISSLRKIQKDLEDSINNSLIENNSKYDELINNLGSKLEEQQEYNKSKLEDLSSQIESSKEEQSKFFEEEKENISKLL